MAARRLDVPARYQRAASRLLQVAIGAVLVVGLVTRNLGVIVNAALALAVTFVPALLRRDYRIHLGPGLTLWITLALSLHAFGMLGAYDEVWWFDHLTHTLSATIVAAGGYVIVRAIDEWSESISLPPRFVFVFVLLFTVGLGVLWEVLEYAARAGADLLGVDPVLVQYGLEDSLLDLLFDTVGAVLVAAFGTDLVSDLVGTVARRLAEARGDGRAPGRSGRRRGGAASLDSVVGTTPSNARLSWATTVLLGLVVAGGLVAGAVLPAVLGAVVVALAVGPALASRDPRATLPWQLLALAGLPVLGAVFARPWLTSAPVTYVSVATVALVVAVELHLFTSVEMTPWFAVSFVVVATMAVAGGWAVGRWLVDLTLGTELLLRPGRTDAEIEAGLMREFVISTLVGLLAGGVFERGFRRRSRSTS
jgi:hypothetical protein